jgi:hypothetical protein
LILNNNFKTILEMKIQRISYQKLNWITGPAYALLLLGAFLLISSSAFTQNANFSGTWTFNEEKSVVGEGGPRGAAVKLVITQEGNNLSIDRTTQRQSGEERTSTEKYTLDGKECENPAFGDRTRTSTAVWSADGKSLTITSKMVFEREGQEMEIITTEVFTLSADKKNLSIDYTSKSSRGERKNTFVYDKE